MEEDLTPEKKKVKKVNAFKFGRHLLQKSQFLFMSSFFLAKFISFSHTFILYKSVVAFESRTMFRFQPV